jgi:hypothetical protein
MLPSVVSVVRVPQLLVFCVVFCSKKNPQKPVDIKYSAHDVDQCFFRFTVSDHPFTTFTVL